MILHIFLNQFKYNQKFEFFIVAKEKPRQRAASTLKCVNTGTLPSHALIYFIKFTCITITIFTYSKLNGYYYNNNNYYYYITLV